MKNSGRITQQNTEQEIYSVIIPLQSIFIAVQRIQVLWMFLSQSQVSFGAVLPDDERHLSANTTVVRIANDLPLIFLK